MHCVSNKLNIKQIQRQLVFFLWHEASVIFVGSDVASHLSWISLLFASICVSEGVQILPAWDSVSLFYSDLMPN